MANYFKNTGKMLKGLSNYKTNIKICHKLIFNQKIKGTFPIFKSNLKRPKKNLIKYLQNNYTIQKSVHSSKIN